MPRASAVPFQVKSVLKSLLSTALLAAVPWATWVEAQTTPNVPFRMSYSADSEMRAPLVVSFRAAVPAEYRVEWVFGDGTRGVGASVQHTYYRPGTYDVQATLTDGSGRPVSRAGGSVQVASSGPERAGLTVLPGFGEVRLSALGSVTYAPGAPRFQVNGREVGAGPVRIADGAVNVSVRVPGSSGQALEQRLSFRMAVLSGSVPFETEVLRLTNLARARGWNCQALREGGAALPPLKQAPLLDTAARAQSAGMALAGYFDHTSGLDGSTPLRRVQAAGFTPSVVAENIAAGQRTPQEVVDGWLRSPGHCRNIMGPFSLIGLSYVQRPGTTYERYWTQVFANP